VVWVVTGEEKLLRERTHSTAGSGVIQAWDVDPSDAWPMAEFEKKTKRYPTDLTDEEWARIERNPNSSA
jgi:hypothetical protein